MSTRSDDLLRWAELLPLRKQADAVTLGEHETPLVTLRRTGAAMGIAHLAVKDESSLPTGSFKARGAAIGVSRARELGVSDVALPTNGNAGSAWAAYGARAGMRVRVTLSRDAPAIHRRECEAAGAEVYLVEGTISDAGRFNAGLVKQHGCFDASSLKEPYRVEGKKTMGFEIARAYGWHLPDVIVYPTGGGVGLIGIHKAFTELAALGLIGPDVPRFVAVQSSGCAPIVQAWRARADSTNEWPNPTTLAYGINVPKAIADFLVLKILYETNGSAVSVDDSSILPMIDQIGHEEGLVLCPEGAATLLAIKQLRAGGWIGADERVLAINTGSGLKYL